MTGKADKQESPHAFHSCLSAFPIVLLEDATTNFTEEHIICPKFRLLLDNFPGAWCVFFDVETAMR
jgi:hypothetical protein